LSTFDVLIFAVAVFAGATSAISGFGIGSLLTPLLALQIGTPAAVAAVTVPHLIGTSARAWRLRAALDWKVLRGFGLLSAAGGLMGAWLYAHLSGRVLTMILGGLLVLTAAAGLTGWTKRLYPAGVVVWLLGWASGFFGGIAGNQGGLRAGAMLSFGLSPVAFIATQSATGLLVDVARMPVYLWSASDTLASLIQTMSLATAGVLVGTFLGERVLLGLPRERFERLVSIAIGILGVSLVFRGLGL